MNETREQSWLRVGRVRMSARPKIGFFGGTQLRPTARGFGPAYRQVLNAIRSMADRQDLVLTGKMEDLRRKVFELEAIIGSPTPLSLHLTLPGAALPIRSIRGLRKGRSSGMTAA